VIGLRRKAAAELGNMRFGKGRIAPSHDATGRIPTMKMNAKSGKYEHSAAGLRGAIAIDGQAASMGAYWPWIPALSMPP